MKCATCGKEETVETCCMSSNTEYDDENKEWVSIQGFIERSGCCKRRLGEGYGDVNHYPTVIEADKITEEWKKKIGIWE